MKETANMGVFVKMENILIFSFIVHKKEFILIGWDYCFCHRHICNFQQVEVQLRTGIFKEQKHADVIYIDRLKSYHYT